MENNLVQQQEQQQQGPKKKLSRTPSSLLRSPTVKSGIDSLSSLAEAAGGGGDESGEGSNSKNKKFCKSKSYTGAAGGTVNRPVAYSSLGNVYYSKTSKAAAPLLSRLRLRAQVMAAPMVLFLVPVVWYYTRGPMLDVLVLGLLFDFLSALAFVAALLISMRMAFSETRLGLRLRLLPPRLAHAAGGVALKFLAFLGDHDKRHGPGGPVTWTIGSTPPPKPSAAAQGRREGVEVFSNGDVYEGEFHQGKCSGSGVYYYFVNGRYEGDWVDGKYDGYGVETWARGSRYRGQYRRGFRHGYGVYRFFTGDMYAGQWANGQSHGTGVQTCDDGSRFVGQFKAGVKHGLGYYHFRNGDTYAGEYFADKMHGFGVYNFANGHRYEGAWHEGKRQGLGMYTFRNGETQSGYWHQGVLQRPSTLNSQIGFIKGVNHANILHAVQEARRAASKAFEVPRVDEKVNKAVAAANKAATAARVAAVKAVQKKIHGNVDAV